MADWKSLTLSKAAKKLAIEKELQMLSFSAERPERLKKENSELYNQATIKDSVFLGKSKSLLN